MIEIFRNIRSEVKEAAETAWKLAQTMPIPSKAAEFLNTVTNYYMNIWTIEEVEFLRFYFNMKMEMDSK